ncbi:hypothetical protein DUNSADRAFT_1425, partial [Dunaliella salina]
SFRSLQKAINFLCYYMIAHTLVFPMTWLTGLWEHWSTILVNIGGAILGGPLMPTEALVKYKGQPAVTMTHNFPAAIWSFLIIIQHSSSIRKTYPRIHRLCGYLHAAVSVVMMASVFPIMKSRDMYFSKHPAVAGLYYIQACWLLFSLAYAILAARAKMFQVHRAWMLRHTASGIWVSVQRVGMLAVFPVLEQVLPFFGIVLNDWHGKVAFGVATVVAFVGCVLFCEAYLWLERRQHLKLA